MVAFLLPRLKLSLKFFIKSLCERSKRRDFFVLLESSPACGYNVGKQRPPGQVPGGGKEKDMPFDFETILDRTGRDALAAEKIPIPGARVNEGFSRIPMWIADMSFATAPSVRRALEARVAHPLFGYFPVSDAYYDAILDWHRARNGVDIGEKRFIGYENGVLGGIAAAVQAFTAPGDAVLLHAPTYVGFTAALRNNGRKIVLSELVRDGAGVWRMDYEDMARKLADEHIHLAVFCSPHNPTGRVWARREIEKAMEVYAQYDCAVLSDEIWSDLLLAGHRHIPTQSVSADARNRTAAFYAPSKTFNLAGLVGSYHVIYSDLLRDRIRKQASLSHYNSCNVLSMHALVGAYCAEGQAWLDALLPVLTRNVDWACDYIEAHFDGVRLMRPEGTYMLFLDCGDWCRAHGRTLDELLAAGVAAGVIWQDGRAFNAPWSIRMNLALPFSLVQEAFARLDKFVFNAR